ncbi:hypothetical protein NIE88_00330 [Sporolactobacillus shoreicorticis]|uniref:Uncharacterized protein n=1 Tax=Sporolactobacillus shoreicorticis TaxID=1923877 RepID=A0ABW5S4R4_9BACL|nr:hypothetical protein [Sporolactobacillus shoreicorticis]MCO7124237.1 hypothetical protein [Sporolactobacillus shoreicorticis]
MLSDLLIGTKQEIISKLQSDNQRLDRRILAIKNEWTRMRAQYEEDMKKLRTIREHHALIKNGEEIHRLNVTIKEKQTKALMNTQK